MAIRLLQFLLPWNARELRTLILLRDHPFAQEPLRCSRVPLQ